MTSAATAPKYQTMSLARAEATGRRAVNWTARLLHQRITEAGRPLRIWESIGHVAGRELFATHTVRAAADAVEVINTAGQVVLRYPLEPTISQAGYKSGVRLLVR